MSGVKLTPEWALKAAQAVQDAVISECEAERFLYMLPTVRGKETMDRHIALALSQAYERGQADSRTSFIEWLRPWVKRRFGKWITHNTATGAFNEYQAAIRSLPIEQDSDGKGKP